MKITFIGAAHEVTGSCTYLEIGNERILIDCGMEQGSDAYENAPLPCPASEITICLITHAHIDHTGRLPWLYKEGFRGRICSTPETQRLSDVMLRDSAHIQESDAEYKTKKALRAGLPPVEPLYTREDVKNVMKLFVPCSYGELRRISDRVEIRFSDIGHLLGSACIEVFVDEGGVKRKLVFSGDIGSSDRPIINDPEKILSADYLMIESTYGDRLHEAKAGDCVTELALAISKTLGRGGNLVIPSFAVGRTQELIYYIREIKSKKLVENVPDFKVYIDSPLAAEATAVFLQCDPECLDDDAKRVMAEGEDPLYFDGLEMISDLEESKALNFDPTPKVIIASSGMCEAGRIRHHLKHNLWRPECAVLFAGYQANGTLGRLLLEGAKTVRLFGEEISVKAEILRLFGVSGHADRNGLLDWLGAFREKPKLVFVDHGEDEVCEAFAETIKNELGIDAVAPFSGDVFDIEKGEFISKATPVPKRRRSEHTGSLPDTRLAEAIARLSESAKKSRISGDALNEALKKLDSLTRELSGQNTGSETVK